MGGDCFGGGFGVCEYELERVENVERDCGEGVVVGGVDDGGEVVVEYVGFVD